MVKTLNCGMDKRFCFVCVEKTAPSWGFPRKEKSAVRQKRGICVFNWFKCDFDGRTKLVPIPETHKGFAIKSETFSSFGIPPYAPKKQCKSKVVNRVVI